MTLDSIYDYERPGCGAGVDFGRGDPVDVLGGLQIYVEYDVDGRGRRLVTTTVPGHSGQWILSFSSLKNLQLSKGESDIEYSAIAGTRLLTTMPTGTGVWFDRNMPGGRMILLPAYDVSMPDLFAEDV
jgi:hypothetical protein